MIIFCFVHIIRLTTFLWWGVKHCRFSLFICRSCGSWEVGGGREGWGALEFSVHGTSPASVWNFYISLFFLLDNTTLTKTKTKTERKHIFTDLLRICTVFISHPLLRNHGDSRQHKVQTPAGNAPTAAQTLSLTVQIQTSWGRNFQKIPM